MNIPKVNIKHTWPSQRDDYFPYGYLATRSMLKALPLPLEAAS